MTIFFFNFKSAQALIRKNTVIYCYSNANQTRPDTWQDSFGQFGRSSYAKPAQISKMCETYRPTNLPTDMARSRVAWPRLKRRFSSSIHWYHPPNRRGQCLLMSVFFLQAVEFEIRAKLEPFPVRPWLEVLLQALPQGWFASYTSCSGLRRIF